MGNMRSLAKKMDELKVLAWTNLEFWQCSLMCVSETWLQKHISNFNVSLSGFQTIKADRDVKRRRNSEGGGIAVLDGVIQDILV